MPDLDGLADDVAVAGEAVCFVEGVLESDQRFVFVVGVDGDVGDQIIEFGVAAADGATSARETALMAETQSAIDGPPCSSYFCNDRCPVIWAKSS